MSGPIFICLNIMRSSAASSSVNSARNMKNVVATDALHISVAATDTGIMPCIAHG